MLIVGTIMMRIKLKPTKIYIYIVTITCISVIFLLQIIMRNNGDGIKQGDILYAGNQLKVASDTKRIAFAPKEAADAVYTKKPIIYSRFTKMKYGAVYVLGAAAGNTTDAVSWDIIKVYASLNRTMYTNSSFRCCLQYANDNDVIEEIPIHSESEHNELLTVFTAQHYTCLNRRHTDGVIPVGVGIATDGIPCDDDHVTFVKPFLPLTESGTTLALCTKIAFGSISAEQIIEWMETYKYLGVDKVLTYYVRKINQNALKVLEYYASTGILDLYQFEAAGKYVIDRDAIFKKHSRQFWNDQQMTIFDSFERMSGYTYFGIIDHDEFLIPSKNRSLKEMLADLFRIHRNSAGFVFLSQYFYTSWGRSGNVNDMTFGMYVNRTATKPEMDNQKCIYMPKYTKYGSAKTHIFTPTKGLLMLTAPAKEGFIRHYRECRWQYVSQTYREKCLHSLERVTDLSMADWSMRIQENVRNVRQKVFGSTDPVS